MARFKYYNGSKWVRPSEVNANPTLAGTETELSGLEIDGVKYKITAGGGSATGSGALYKHVITDIFDSNNNEYTLTFLSKYSDAFANNEDLFDFLTNINSKDDDLVIISPMVKGESDAQARIVYGITVDLQNYSIGLSTTLGTVNISMNWSQDVVDTVSTYITGGSGGDTPSVTGGSGKLYEIKFDLTQYDNNGTAVEINMGLLGTYSTLTYHIQFYESNFEKIKTEFNAISQANNLGITVNTPQDFVAMINMFDDTTGSGTNSQAYSLIYYLIGFADKAYFSINFSDGTNEVPMLFEIIGADFFGNISYTRNGQMYTITFVGLDPNAGEYFVGIDVNNSCTLTEYGTSASGGGSGTGTQTIHSNVVFINFDEICSADPDPLMMMVPRDKLDQLLTLVSQQLGTTINVENLSQAWSAASEYEKRALLYYLNLIAVSMRMYYKLVVGLSFDSTEVNGQTVYTAAYADISITTNNSATGGGYGLNYSKNELDDIDTSTLSIDLGEQTIQGGGSGDTVEAEPIISIKMTNLDVRVLDSDPQKIGDFEFYCTKKRWDDFVSLAASYFQTEVTYQNFDTVFKALTLVLQRFALGYLLMDYYTKEIIPNALILERKNDQYFGILISKSPLSSVVTATYPSAPNPEYVFSTVFNDQNVTIIGLDNSGTDLVTQNTVITVEEIAGAAIGSSAGGGTSNVLYKHSIPIVVNDGEDDYTVMFDFLSKYGTPFVTNSGLDTLLTNLMATGDTQAYFNPTVTGTLTNNITMMISGIQVKNDRVSLYLLAQSLINQLGAYYTSNTNITDTVTPYAQGGSGGSGDAGGAHTKYTVTAQYNSNELKLMLYFLCNEEELYSDLNAGFALLNTQLGISLNTHCASESDIVDNFNILQQIDTSGGSDPDNNALVFGALGLLARTEKCIKVTMPYIAEFGTDLNSVDVMRSNGSLGGMGLYYVNDSGVNTPINVSAFIGHTGVTYGCNIEEIDGGGSSSGGGSSVELPSYVEITTQLTASGSGQATIYATMTEGNLDIFIETANQQLSSYGYTLTKQNWSTLIPQLATAVPALRYALIQGFIRLSTNLCAEDIDGYSSMVFVDVLGIIKLGHDTYNYDTITDSYITPITNHY